MRALLVLTLVSVALGAACSGGVFKPQYEYEEELYLDLDGSATLNLNASVASLVALHGVDLRTDPRARVDRERVRALFTTPGADATVSLSRRHGRRFVHVSVDVNNVRELSRLRPFAWSSYRFNRRDDVFEYRQTVGPPAGTVPGHADWDGTERVAFRMHLPSEILFHNTGGKIQRGNILEWEQPLADRLNGEPLELRADMATESILYTTLLLFGGTIAAAAVTFGAVIWWVARRGRTADAAEPTS